MSWDIAVPLHMVIYRGSFICYSALLSKIRAHTHKEIIEFVSNALFTGNVNPIALKMTGEFRCVSFLVLTFLPIRLYTS